MWKTILIVLVVILVILGIGYALYYYTQTNPPKNEEEIIKTDEELIAQVLANKYGKPAEDLTLDIQKRIDDYILGGVTFAPGGPGNTGFFLAAKKDNQWHIAADGNGSIACSDIEPYDFPIEIINECVDEDGSLNIKDYVYRILDNLIKITSLEFSDMSEGSFEWRIETNGEIETQNLIGKEIKVDNITTDDLNSILELFENYGMKQDLNNAADGPTGTLMGYTDDNIICLIQGEWEIETANSKNVTASCADLIKQPGPSLANPASVYCEEQGGTLEMREEEGGTAGYCIFKDGSECEEWAYFNEECVPGENFPAAANIEATIN